MSTQTTPSCHPDRKHKGRGLCNACWQAEYRAANPSAQWARRHPEEAKAYQQAWYQENKERIAARRRGHRATGRYRERDRRLWLKSYGLTPEQYRDMLVGQAGRCGICGFVTDLVIDHDHQTGRVRGLLCTPCNQALGKLRDDPKRMLVAAAYVTAGAA